MNAKTEEQIETKEEIKDDVSDQPIAPTSEAAVDLNKLAALKAKSQAKQMEQKLASLAPAKEKSIVFGVIGSGQAGSRLAEAFHKLDYEVVAINTAMQDLKYIDIPESNKLLLQFGAGGAAKDIELGKAAAESHRIEIVEIITSRLADSQVNILCLSLGGGSGAGSCEVLVDVLMEIGKPIVAMCILPMDSEDASTKRNALETLSKLTKLTQTQKLANLIVVDNAKLESIYQHVSQMDFFGTANKAIVNPIDVFNTYSRLPSSTKPLDSMEFSKLFLDGEGLSIYGELTVSNFREDTSLASAVIDNLDGNLLAGGFNLKQAKYVGVIFAANKEVWAATPTSSVNYAMSMINDKCASPNGVFKGIYTVDMPENAVKIYSFFSGLALPEDRVEQLKKETKELAIATKGKNEQRNLSLKIDSGTEENISEAQKIKAKIAAKSSNFGKFVNNVTDRRK